MAIDFEYEVEDTGWARAAILDGDRRLDFSVSYLSDPLGDLATLARRYVNGFAVVDIPFVYEPGAHVCHFMRDREQVLLTVRDDSACLGGPASSAAPVVFEAREHHRVFAVNVCRLLDRLWRRHGLVDYKRRWQGAEFPLHQYLSLRLMLDRSPLVERIAEGVRAGASTRSLELALLDSAADLSPERAALDFGGSFGPEDA